MTDTKTPRIRPFGGYNKATTAAPDTELTHVGPGSAPVYLVQGTTDLLVPQIQAETFMSALKEKGIANELVIKKGAGHGWLGMDKDLEQFAKWFDKHLAKAK